MKRLICIAFGAALLGGTTAMADGPDYNRFDPQHQHDRLHWGPGDHFAGHSVAVDDWRGHQLRRPPHGYHWVQNDDGDFLLVGITTNIVRDMHGH